MFLRKTMSICMLASVLATVSGTQQCGIEPVDVTFHVNTETTIRREAIPSDFLGISMEYSDIGDYLGSVSRPNRVYETLMKNLGGGVLRVGGDSEDLFCQDSPLKPPCKRNLTPENLKTPEMLKTISATMGDTNWKAILGVNLAVNDPNEGMNMIQQGVNVAFPENIRKARLAGIEIGNEGNLYIQKGYPDAPCTADVHARRFEEYVRSISINQATSWAAVKTSEEGPYIVGPAYKPRASDGGNSAPGPCPPVPAPPVGESSWTPYLKFGDFMRDVGDDHLAFITYHWYTLDRLRTEGLSPEERLVREQHRRNDLLSLDRANLFKEKIRELVDAVQQPHAGGKRIRLAEVNSVSNYGQPNVSDTMAAALWGLDFMFAAYEVGVRGINFHTSNPKNDPVNPQAAVQKNGGPFAPYNPVTLRQDAAVAGGFKTEAQPLYYSLLLFKQAVGSTLLHTTSSNDQINVQTWSVKAPDKSVMIFIINKSGKSQKVKIVPSQMPKESPHELRLSATSLASHHVILGGQTVSDTDGTIPSYNIKGVPANFDGSYTVDVGAAEAVRLWLKY